MTTTYELIEMLRTELRNCLDRKERRQIEAELADAMERQSSNEAAPDAAFAT